MRRPGARDAKLLARWYATPAGGLFAVGIALLAVPAVSERGVHLTAIPGLLLLALVVPRKFLYHRTRAEDLSTRLTRESYRLNGLAKRVDKATEAAHSRTAKTEAEILKLKNRGVSARQAARAVSASLDGVGSRATVIERETRDLSYQLGATGKKVDRVSDAATRANETVGRTNEALAQALTSLADISQRLDRVSGISAEIHNRDLTAELCAEIVEKWSEPLNLGLDRRHLQAQAHRIVALEAQAMGRIATNIEDVITRCLAAQSIARPTTEILEIGTLFGIGGLAVRDAVAPWAEHATLTLIDPLAGYYGPEHLDPPTGLPVTRALLDRNIAFFGAGTEEVRVLEGFSTDEEICAEASDRLYDLLIVDGDHSYDGVRLDVESYSDLVRDGGIMIIDDYGATAWPDVTRYTDDVLMSDKRFDFLGASYRTALFRRRDR